MQSCCSLIGSASAAAPRPIASIHFNCCSPFAFASAAARRLHPLQLRRSIASVSTAPRLRAPRLRLIQLLLLNCIRFDCCSPPAVLEDSSPCPMFSAEIEVQVHRSCVTSLVPPHEHPISVTHGHTIKILISNGLRLHA